MRGDLERGREGRGRDEERMRRETKGEGRMQVKGERDFPFLSERMEEQKEGKCEGSHMAIQPEL